MEVQVLGTSFGITAYDDEIFQTVVLKEGSVFVKNNQGNGQTIQPNQCLMVEKEEMTVKDVDVYDYISWIDGVLQFLEKKTLFFWGIFHAISGFWCGCPSCSNLFERISGFFPIFTAN